MMERGKTNHSNAMIGDIVDFLCPDCQKTRKRVLRKLGVTIGRCGSCATTKSHKDNPRIGRQETHYNWKGGILRTSQGYILEYVRKDSPYFPMASCCRSRKTRRFGAYALQHRLIMAKHLGRCLTVTELVHHVNGNKSDNCLSNLRIVCKADHGTNYQQGFKDGFAEAMRLHKKRWDGERWVEKEERKCGKLDSS